MKFFSVLFAALLGLIESDRFDVYMDDRVKTSESMVRHARCSSVWTVELAAVEENCYTTLVAKHNSGIQIYEKCKVEFLPTITDRRNFACLDDQDQGSLSMLKKLDSCYRKNNGSAAAMKSVIEYEEHRKHIKEVSLCQEKAYGINSTLVDKYLEIKMKYLNEVEDIPERIDNLCKANNTVSTKFVKAALTCKALPGLYDAIETRLCVEDYFVPKTLKEDSTLDDNDKEGQAARTRRFKGSPRDTFCESYKRANRNNWYEFQCYGVFAPDYGYEQSVTKLESSARYYKDLSTCMTLLDSA